LCELEVNLSSLIVVEKFKKTKFIFMKFKLLFIALLFSCFSLGQIIYQDNFGTSAITTSPYSATPSVFDTNLNTFSWSTSAAGFAGFTGNGGGTSASLSLNNSSGTPTMTFTFNVASGYQLNVTQFDFWRVRSTTGAQNWSMTINGIAVGSGTTTTTGASLGATNVSNAINNLSGTITVVLSLSGASGAGTFRLDDFTLFGSLTAACTSPSTQASLFTSSLVTSTTATIGLTRGNGNRVLIVGRAGGAVNQDPASGTSYTASTVFGTGTQIGTGNFVVYDGFASPTVSVGLTSLVGGTAYHFAAYEYNTTGTCYNLVELTGTFTTLTTTPNVLYANNGTQVLAANVSQGTLNHILHTFQITLSSATTNLTGIANLVMSGTYVASDIVNFKIRYSTDNVLDAGDATLSTKTIGLTGNQTFSLTTQTLPIGISYIFITADFSATATIGNTIGTTAVNPITASNVVLSSGSESGTTTASGLQTIRPIAPNVPTLFSEICTSNTTQSLSWSPPAAGTFDGYILVVREGVLAPHAVTSLIASSQIFNTDYNLAPTYGSTAILSRVLYIGTATNAMVSGLTQGVNYTFALYTYKNDGATSLYSSTATLTNQTIALFNVTGAGSTPANTSGTIVWGAPNSLCYNEILVVATTNPGITFTPSGNGSTYIPNTVYAGNNSIVFNNAGDFVTVTGLTNGITYYFEIFVRIGTQWSTGVEVPLTPNASTVFKPGELMFVGFDGQVFSTAAADQYMLATMVDILPGTTFSLANSRYEAGAPANVRTNKWGGAGNDPSATPGVTNFTYNGATVITAGSVLVLNTNSATSPVFDYVGIITGTTFVDRTADFTMTQPFGIGTAPNITTAPGDGEQIYLLQGNFVSDGTIDLNEANYILNGTLLHGFTIKTGWVPLTSTCSGVNGGGSNRQSRLPSTLDCFNLESAVTNTISGFYQNAAQHGPTSLRNIIREIANVGANWTLSSGRYTIDASNNVVNRAGRTFVISTGSTAGQWVGDVDTNWFNCANWGRLSVPDETVDVVIDNVVSVNNALINFLAPFSDLYTDLAKCNNIIISGRSLIAEANPNNILEVYGNLTIASPGVLDMNDGNNSTADGTTRLYGNWTNNSGLTAFDEGNGTIEFLGAIPQIINNNVPTNTEEFFNVILDNDFDTGLSNNLIARGNLTVLANHSVIVRDNNFIQVNRNLNNNGLFEIDNNGILMQVEDSGINTGNILMRRNASIRQLDYVFWSSPINQFTVNNISPATPANVIWKWNPRITNPNGGVGNWENCAAETMLLGKGYIVRGPNGHSTATPSTFTATFQNAIANAARPNNGIITQRLHRGPMVAANLGSYTSANSIPLSVNDDNWNLVGNPYPSAISALSFLNYNALTVPVIEGSIRIWTHNTLPISTVNPFYNSYQYNYTANDYITHNGTATISGPTGFNGSIGAGQGFFVLMNDGAQTNDTDAPINLVFNNAMRVRTNNSNSQFYRTANTTVTAAEDKHRIWIDLVSSSGNVVRTVVGYLPNATFEKDVMYDAFAKLDGNLNFYSLITNDKVCIQGRPAPFESSDLVPLGIAIAQEGNYTIAIAYLDGLFESNQEIYVEDKLLNIIHNLKTSPYTFTSASGVFDTRFVLRYTSTSLTNNEFETLQNIVVTTQEQQISIKSASEKMSSVIVYDMLGREIIKKDKLNVTEILLSNINARNQALIIKITLENGLIETRKIIL
jgi:hypothetical protein